MVNRPRNAGTRAETAFVKLLNQMWWPFAERSPLRGRGDRGDTTGHPGFVCEVKYQSKGAPLLALWLRETDAEIANAKADFGHVVYSPPGVGERSVERWYSMMWNADAQRLWNEANGSVQNLRDAPSLTRVSMSYPKGRLDLARRLKVAEEERIKVGAGFSEIIIEPSRHAIPDSYNVTPVRQRLELLHLAGY